MSFNIDANPNNADWIKHVGHEERKVTTKRVTVIRCNVLTTQQFVHCMAAVEVDTIEAHMRTHFKRDRLPRMTPAELAQSSYIRTYEEEIVE